MVDSDHLDVDERPLQEANEACREPLLPFRTRTAIGPNRRQQVTPSCQGYPKLLISIEQRIRTRSKCSRYGLRYFLNLISDASVLVVSLYSLLQLQCRLRPKICVRAAGQRARTLRHLLSREVLHQLS